MAHIVFITSGLTGLFNASLALMQQLVAVGHQITYASPCQSSDSLQAPLTTLGIPHVQLEPWNVPSEPESSKSAASSQWEKWRRIRVRQQQAVVALGIDHFSETLQSLHPDLLLIDIEMHPHIMTAVTGHYNVALLCPFISIWRRPNLPPIHTNIVPGEGWRGQWWGIQWSWLRYSWRKWKAFQCDRAQKAGLDYISVLRCYARQIGYPFYKRFGFDQWLVPYPHSSLPILCLHAQALDFPHKPHPSMHYLGPMVSEVHAENVLRQDVETALGLDTFLQNRHGHCLIYCGCSSFASVSQTFFQQLIAIASICPEWDFVIGLGNSLKNNLDGLSRRSTPNISDTFPANVCVLPWAPQRQILNQADCAIINGGAHSITECIHFGVPMLVYPLQCNDQYGNAARVVYHGLGIVSQLGQDSEMQIQQHLQALLANESYKIKLNQMRQQFQRYAYEKTSVRVIESLLFSPVTEHESLREEAAS